MTERAGYIIRPRMSHHFSNVPPQTLLTIFPGTHIGVTLCSTAPPHIRSSALRLPIPKFADIFITQDIYKSALSVLFIVVPIASVYGADSCFGEPNFSTAVCELPVDKRWFEEKLVRLLVAI